MTQASGREAFRKPQAKGPGATARREASAASRLQPDELELAWRLARLPKDRRRLVIEAADELRRDLPDAVSADAGTFEEGRG